MYFLCLNCGEINQNEELCCRNCGSELDTKEYNHLMKYSKRAFEYGFDYRLAYEEQVKNYGEVKVKFSLVSPENYQTWMAAAALSGMIGNLAYDLVKYVGKKIIEQLKTKEEPLNYSEKIIIEIISDNNKLIQFTNYIQGYYKGNSKLNKEVEKAIIEEEIVHTMVGKDSEKIMTVLENYDEKETDPEKSFGEIFIASAKLAGENRLNKPKIEELQNALSALKKELKKEKKHKKKGKK